MLTLKIVAAMSILASSAFGQDNPLKAEYKRLTGTGKRSEVNALLAKAYPEGDLAKLRGLGMFVSAREEDRTPLIGITRPFSYKYQRMMLEAARVNVSTNSEEVIGDKVRRMWKVAEELGMTEVSGPGFTDASIIKFAVNQKFDEFLIDLTRWRVHLNKLDSDHTTVLDYTQSRVESSKGLASERILKRYYDMLRNAGAKHAHELK